MNTLLLLAVAGLLIGYIGGYTGLGGAPFLIAFLVFGLQMTQYRAQGTVLAIMLGPMSGPATWVLRQRFMVLWRAILLIVSTYILAGYFGARLAFGLPEQQLRIGFAVLLIFLGAQTAYRAIRQKQVPACELNPLGFTVCKAGISPPRTWHIGALGLLTGFFGGLFGVGAGVLLMPLLTGPLGIHKDDARVLSLAILLPPSTIGAVWKYQQEGAVDWTAAGIMLIAYLLTNYFGALAGKKASVRKFNLFLGSILAALGMLSLAMAVR